METKAVDIQDTSLEALLELIEANVEVLLLKDDAPLARLSPIAASHPPIKPRIPGLHAGTTWVSDDFDAPLPDEFWLGES